MSKCKQTAEKKILFAFIDLESRFSRQGVEEGNEVPDLGQVAQAGERCVEKVMMIEETTYDDQIVCHHSYSTKCHITYITDYEAVQVAIFLLFRQIKKDKSHGFL